MKMPVFKKKFWLTQKTVGVIKSMSSRDFLILLNIIHGKPYLLLL